MTNTEYKQRLEKILREFVDAGLTEPLFDEVDYDCTIKDIMALNEEAIGADEHRKDCPANGFTCVCEMWRQNKNSRSEELKAVIGVSNE